jgi:hypothetical protein
MASLLDLGWRCHILASFDLGVNEREEYTVVIT